MRSTNWVFEIQFRCRRPSMTIVIPSFDGRSLLEQNLGGVVAEVASWPRMARVVVVDDGSSDGTAEWLRESWPQVQLVRLERNRGFAAAMNAGFAAADGEVVVALNNDMRVESGFLGPLVEALRDPEVFAVGCRTLLEGDGGDEGVTEGEFRRGRLGVLQPGLGRDGVRDWPSRPILYAHGGAAAYRLAAVRELGGFDPMYAPFYWEDLDLCYRAWKRGWKVTYKPGSVVHHRHQATIGRYYPLEAVRQTMAANMLLFTWKNVSDGPLMRSHMTWLAARVAVNLARGNLGFFRSLRSALQRLPLALEGRSRESKHRRRTDADVLALSRCSGEFKACETGRAARMGWG